MGIPSPTVTETRYAVRTHKPVEAAVEAVQQALAGRRFSVLWALDINEKLREKGLELNRECRILEVCNAARAKEALEANPAVSYFLPCKIIVSQMEDGTEIGLPRPTALMGLVGDAGLQDLAQEVEQALVEAVREAAR